MTWVIACFCGHLIETTTCPHCGSRLPEFSGPAPAAATRLHASGNETPVARAEHLPSLLVGSNAA